MAGLVFDPNAEVDLEASTIDQEAPGIDSDLLDNVNTTVRSFNSNRESAADLAWLQATMKEGGNPVEEYQNTLSRLEGGESLSEIQNQIKLEHMAKLESDIVNNMGSILTSEDPQLQSLAGNIASGGMTAIAELQKEYLEDDGLELMKADLLTIGSTQELGVRREMTRQSNNRLLAEALEEKGAVGTTLDFLEGALPLNFTLDMNDMFGKIWGGQDAFLKLALEYQTLDPQEQQVVFKQDILPAILDAADDENVMAARAITELLNNPRVLHSLIGSSALDLIGVADITKLGVSGVKYANSLRQAAMLSGSKAKNLENLANQQAAASMVDIARQVDDAGPVGMGKLDIARSADPINNQILSSLKLRS